MQVILQHDFQKRFMKLLPKIREKFYERAEIFLYDQYNIVLNNHSVEKRFPGCRSINVTGDYRAIFYVQSNVAVFINIGTHAELY